MILIKNLLGVGFLRLDREIRGSSAILSVRWATAVGFVCGLRRRLVQAVLAAVQTLGPGRVGDLLELKVKLEGVGNASKTQVYVALTFWVCGGILMLLNLCLSLALKSASVSLVFFSRTRATLMMASKSGIGSGIFRLLLFSEG